MSKFEKALLKHGALALINMRDLIEYYEMYEDCAEINRILTKHSISLTFEAEDWKNQNWGKGAVTDIGILDIHTHYHNALIEVYGQGFIDSITAKYNHIKFKQI